MKIRLMKMTDYKDVIATWQTAGLTVDQVNDSKQVMGEILKMNPKGSFVAEADGKIVGGVWGAFNGRRLWVYHLAVKPEYQNQGVGTKLFKAVEEAAIEIGVPKMSLGVELTNLKVVPFYEKFGFKAEGDALWLGKSLKGSE